MGIKKVWEIKCDSSDGCMHTLPLYLNEVYILSNIKAFLLASGWKNKDGKWFCIDCAKKLEGK